jgi:predicted site-specific integrase-resolvase
MSHPLAQIDAEDLREVSRRGVTWFNGQRHEEIEVVINARVFLATHQADLDRQVSRLKEYCATHGAQVGRMVTEIGSGVNDSRRTLLALLTDP